MDVVGRAQRGWPGRSCILEVVLEHPAKSVPQRLKPAVFRSGCGTPEGVPLSKTGSAGKSVSFGEFSGFRLMMKRYPRILTQVRLVLAWFFLVLSGWACFGQPVPAASLRPRVIVFVHGLHGNHETWRAANGAYWPDLVKTDPRFAYSDVEVAEYPSPASNGKMSSVQLADMLWNRLRVDRVWEHREVVFVAHSLGGILVEEMLLRHPAEAGKVRFVVSYGTPHEGSTVARIASVYDKDPLLNDLSDASSNTFLTQLESNWRGNDAVNGIHRFCAYESEDTIADEGLVRYLRPHTRVVSYFSATYGCDVTTPPQEIHADHLHMVKPTDRASSAYDFFRRVVPG